MGMKFQFKIIMLKILEKKLSTGSKIHVGWVKIEGLNLTEEDWF